MYAWVGDKRFSGCVRMKDTEWNSEATGNYSFIHSPRDSDFSCMYWLAPFLSFFCLPVGLSEGALCMCFSVYLSLNLPLCLSFSRSPVPLCVSVGITRCCDAALHCLFKSLLPTQAHTRPRGKKSAIISPKTHATKKNDPKKAARR